MVIMTPPLIEAYKHYFDDVLTALSNRKIFIIFIVLMILNGIFWVGALYWMIYKIYSWLTDYYLL